MARIFQFALIKSSERDIIQQIHEANPEESSLWKIPNIWVPIATIALALLVHFCFSERRFDILAYVNIVLNGSLPLIAINQISGIGLHVFKFEKGKENKYGVNFEYLRTKLFFHILGIFAFGVIGFAYQAIHQSNNVWEILLSFAVSVFLLLVSSDVSKKIFLLQENLIDNTFEKVIVSEADKKHGNDW